MLSRVTSAALRFLEDEGGPAAVEYAVLLALIVVVCLAAVGVLGGKVANATFTSVGSQVGNAGS
jgi:pilus assembly protein Flp/PilA